MKTKAEIVQSLLNEGKLSAEDAVVLLMKDVQYIYIQTPQPSYPNYPLNPFWYDVVTSEMTNSN